VVLAGAARAWGRSGLLLCRSLRRGASACNTQGALAFAEIHLDDSHGLLSARVQFEKFFFLQGRRAHHQITAAPERTCEYQGQTPSRCLTVKQARLRQHTGLRDVPYADRGPLGDCPVAGSLKNQGIARSEHDSVRGRSERWTASTTLLSGQERWAAHPECLSNQNGSMVCNNAGRGGRRCLVAGRLFEEVEKFDLGRAALKISDRRKQSIPHPIERQSTRDNPAHKRSTDAQRACRS